MNTVWPIVRWGLMALVMVGSLWLFLRTVTHVPAPQGLPFQLWYGNWRAVLIVTGLFTLFLLGFTRPQHKVEWRNAGLYTAFLISLFTEMFGIPLTIYLLAPFLGLPPWAFGANESHLWAFALDRVGLLPLHLGVYLVMVVSIGLLVVGVSLVALGWYTIYRRRGGLVTEEIYSLVRHPQYLGLILIVFAFTIQWPTLPTLLMAPVLIVMYVRLARREDEELATVFGLAFLDYRSQVPALIPRWPRPGVEPATVREDPLTPATSDSSAKRLSDRFRVRRGLVLWLLTGGGALAATIFSTLRLRAAESRDYEDVARWRLPGGEGLFIATAPEPTLDWLQALGERLRRRFRNRQNVVVMVFDDPEAARQVRRGSRVIGEERFQAALARQRAMYLKHAERGKHSLTIYGPYPVSHEIIQY